ncbi:hypothetical protein ACIOHR_37640 [Streptomyces anulatus]
MRRHHQVHVPPDAARPAPPRTGTRTLPDTRPTVSSSDAAHGRSTTPLTLPAAAVLLCSLHDPDELTDMGLRIVRHTTRVTAATQHRDPVVLELTDAPEQDNS